MKVVREKHPFLIRSTHWINIPLLFVMIWSGILIYWANQAYIKIPNSLGPFQIHHRLAEGMGWHFFIMWAFALNGLVYVLTVIKTGRVKSIVPTKKTLSLLLPYFLHSLKIKTAKVPYEGNYNPVQQLAYTTIIFSGFGSLLSGLAIYKPVTLGWLTELLGGYEAARLEHFIFMAVFLIFIPVHIVQVLRSGWNHLRAMIAGFELKGHDE